MIETSCWVTARVFAQIYGLSEQTLANWRHQDRVAGRVAAPPGKPRYRRWGTAVRYFLPTDERPNQTA